jgi:hypothetical protein
MALLTNFLGQSNSLPSPAIWDRFPFIEAVKNKDVFEFYDDFRRFNLTSGNPWVTDVSDNLATAANVTNSPDGLLRLAITGDDNEEVWIIADTTGGMMSLKADRGDAAYECRFAKSSIATDTAIAFGMVVNGTAAGDDVIQVDTTGELADVSYIAFSNLHTAGATLRFSYRTASGTAVTHVAAAHTMVAATFAKAGFVYEQGTGKVQAYINGAKVGLPVAISATGFPDNVTLTPFFAAKVGDDLAVNLDCAWVRCAQKIVA